MTDQKWEQERAELSPKKHGRAGTRQGLRAEWIKITSVRSTWICLVLIVVVGVSIAAFISNIEASRWADLSLIEKAQFDPVRVSQGGAILSEFVVGVLGVLVITSEYGSGMIRTTLASYSKRRSVLFSKVAVLSGVLFVVSELTAFASFFVSRAVLISYGAKPFHGSIIAQTKASAIPVLGIGDPGVVRAIALGGVFLVLLGLLGMGIGFIIRHTAGAISIFVGLLLIVPIIISLLPASITNSFQAYLPGTAGQAMSAVVSRSTGYAGELLTPWMGALVMTLWALGALVLGWIVLSRRDA